MNQFQTPASYRALDVNATDGNATRQVVDLPWETLPDNDVTVRVHYSSLNYKDALSAHGRPGVTRDYPHTPGIDAAGTVVASSDARFSPGDEVLCTGYDLGVSTRGGLAEFVRVPGEWLVPLPAGLSSRDAMALGTAGFTAALALDRLAFAGVTTSLGPLVVTGASGGVGSLGVALAALAGYEVVASSGKAGAEPLLLRLGAARRMGREELGEASSRPLLRGVYGGGIDTVGGTTLENLVKSTAIGGAVAACGLVGGSDLNLTVFPFILRGVALLGVDSEHADQDTRLELWAALAGNQRLLGLLRDPELVSEVGMAELEAPLAALLAGEVVGRVVVRIGDA